MPLVSISSVNSNQNASVNLFSCTPSNHQFRLLIRPPLVVSLSVSYQISFISVHPSFPFISPSVRRTKRTRISNLDFFLILTKHQCPPAYPKRRLQKSRPGKVSLPFLDPSDVYWMTLLVAKSSGGSKKKLTTFNKFMVCSVGSFPRLSFSLMFWPCSKPKWHASKKMNLICHIKTGSSCHAF